VLVYLHWPNKTLALTMPLTGLMGHRNLSQLAMIPLVCHVFLSLLDGAVELLDPLIFASLEPVLSPAPQVLLRVVTHWISF